MELLARIWPSSFSSSAVVLGTGHAIVERLACSAHLKTRETADDENDDDEDDWRGTTRFATGY
jgi:hypothetical protein